MFNYLIVFFFQKKKKRNEWCQDSFLHSNLKCNRESPLERNGDFPQGNSHPLDLRFHFIREVRRETSIQWLLLLSLDFLLDAEISFPLLTTFCKSEEMVFFARVGENTFSLVNWIFILFLKWTSNHLMIHFLSKEIFHNVFLSNFFFFLHSKTVRKGRRGEFTQRILKSYGSVWITRKGGNWKWEKQSNV